jgi:hypothetical protein
MSGGHRNSEQKLTLLASSSRLNYLVPARLLLNPARLLPVAALVKASPHDLPRRPDASVTFSKLRPRWLLPSWKTIPRTGVPLPAVSHLEIGAVAS